MDIALSEYQKGNDEKADEELVSLKEVVSDGQIPLYQGYIARDSGHLPQSHALIDEVRGELATAHEHLLNAIKYRPDEAEIWYQLARIEEAQGYFIDALNSLQQAVRYQPRPLHQLWAATPQSQ